LLLITILLLLITHTRDYQQLSPDIALHSFTVAKFLL